MPSPHTVNDPRDINVLSAGVTPTVQ